MTPVTFPIMRSNSTRVNGCADTRETCVRQDALTAQVKPDFDFIGRHLLVSYADCDFAALTDRDGLRTCMREAVNASGATLLSCVDHIFVPHGFTMLALLSESHASIHTYPEHAACFVDLFTCGQKCCAEAFEAVFRTYLRPGMRHCSTWIRHHEIERDAFKGQP